MEKLQIFIAEKVRSHLHYARPVDGDVLAIYMHVALFAGVILLIKWQIRHSLLCAKTYIYLNGHSVLLSVLQHLHLILQNFYPCTQLRILVLDLKYSGSRNLKLKLNTAETIVPRFSGPFSR